MGKPVREEIEAQVEDVPPIEPKKPRTIFKFVPPQEPTQHNAHVNEWYRHECERLGKQVSALEFKLGAYNDAGGNRVYADDIITKMCEYYGVSKIDIRSERRTRKLVLFRHKMIWVVKRLTMLSYPPDRQAFRRSRPFINSVRRAQDRRPHCCKRSICSGSERMAGMTDADLLRENGRLRKRVEELERERRDFLAALREPTPFVVALTLEAVNLWQNDEGEDEDICRAMIHAIEVEGKT